MSGDGQLEVRGVGRMLESFAASPRLMRRGLVQTHPQWSDALYTPRLRQYEEWDVSAIAALGVGASLFVGMAGSLSITTLIYPQGGDAQLNFFGIVFGAVTLLGSGATAGIIPGSQRRQQRLRNALSSDFYAWAKARYGLDLQPEEVDKLVDFIAVPKENDQRLSFAHQDKTFKIVAHDGKFYIEQQRDVSALDYAASSPLAIEAEDALKQLRELPGEAGLLGERLLELLALSADEELSVEQDHVLRRVRADALQVISLHAKLVKLQALDAANETALRDTVASLTGEVDDIIQQWRQEVRNEVAVQRDYVRERRLHAPARLMLPKGTDASELAPVVEA